MLLLLGEILTLQEPTPQNGQTHPNNSLGAFDHFVGLALKGLRISLGLRIVKWNSTILKFL